MAGTDPENGFLFSFLEIQTKIFYTKGEISVKDIIADFQTISRAEKIYRLFMKESLDRRYIMLYIFAREG